MNLITSKMKNLQVVFVYAIIALFALMAIHAWYIVIATFLCEESVLAILPAVVFTSISITGLILRKQIIKEL